MEGILRNYLEEKSIEFLNTLDKSGIGPKPLPMILILFHLFLFLIHYNS